MEDDFKSLSDKTRKLTFKKFRVNLSKFFMESLAGIFLSGCMMTLIYQVFHWLSKGSWQELPLFNILESFSEFRTWGWIHHPDNWIGLHSIVASLLNTGLAFVFLVLSMVSLWIGVEIDPE